MALNCCVAPITKFEGGFGVTAISEIADEPIVLVVLKVDEDVVEQATAVRVKVATSTRVGK
jgi:hypothetical protein